MTKMLAVVEGNDKGERMETQKGNLVVLKWKIGRQMNTLGWEVGEEE